MGDAKPRVLIVDDDVQLLAALGRLLSHKGYAVDVADGGDAGIQQLADCPYDIIITDIKMPHIDGHEVLRAARRRCPNAEVVMLTGYGTVESAVQAMREGAFDYLTKPPEPDELLITLGRILDFKGLVRENIELKEALAKRPAAFGMVGSHPKMRAVYDLIEAVSRRDTTVLICGESGTGKELVARAIHDRSARASKPFVVVNCAALAGELLENELFGHEKGAFTDATQRRLGKFEAADGGTLFLDEIGATTPTLQQKLLRFLQDRCFERVGAVETLTVDVRVVAATNSDLRAMMASGRFREDLYYRLDVLRIDVPALRERRGDIPALVHHFLKLYSQPEQLRRIAPEALRAMEEYDWPGNVRQLENAVQRGVILARGEEIGLGDLPADVVGEASIAPPPDAASGLKAQLDAFERQIILRALAREGWNQTKAAEALLINRTTLIEKMRKYGLAKAEMPAEA
jgi:DNA-binding NtrC family response regulator